MAIEIVTPSNDSASSGRSPVSEESQSATRPDQSKSVRRVPPRVAARTWRKPLESRTSRAASALGDPNAGSRKSVPIEPRTAFSFQSRAPPEIATIALAPAASAVRASPPRFPGSAMPAATTTSASSVNSNSASSPRSGCCASARMPGDWTSRLIPERSFASMRLTGTPLASSSLARSLLSSATRQSSRSRPCRRASSTSRSPSRSSTFGSRPALTERTRLSAGFEEDRMTSTSAIACRSLGELVRVSGFEKIGPLPAPVGA